MRNVKIESPLIQGSKIEKRQLHWMATLGDDEAIRILAKFGAEINAQDVDGCTPMHAAILSRQLTAVRELRFLGADLMIEDNQGRSALDAAISEGYLPVMDFCLSLLDRTMRI